ncbi:MAG: hypothetical protein QOG03_583 [Actinomycetota bacterium]|jgi:effector-binding domain-containing protein|nr:hypothetical protein [Actinomycetota bacterium]
MAYDVSIETAVEYPTAVARAESDMAGLPTTIITLLDQVYAGLEATGARQQGQNIVLYVYGGDTFAVEAGVQVDGPFVSDGPVVPSVLPGGRVARTRHVGPYGELHQAHVAVQRWCEQQGETLAGPNWEIYGDWNDDESKLETEVLYLLA